MIRFRVYPERRKLYYEVRIYATRKRMLRAIRHTDKSLGVRGDWSKAQAVCRSIETLKRCGKKWKLTPRVGVVFLHRGWMGAGVVAHEMAHAAVQYARRVRLQGGRVWRVRGWDENPVNERFAWIAGELNRQFWTNYYKQRRAGA